MKKVNEGKMDPSAKKERGDEWAKHLKKGGKRVANKKIRKAGKSMEETLSVPEKHQKKIAISTLKMSDAGTKIMGGMTKDEARTFLKKIGYSESKIKKLEESMSGDIWKSKMNNKFVVYGTKGNISNEVIGRYKTETEAINVAKKTKNGKVVNDISNKTIYESIKQDGYLLREGKFGPGTKTSLKIKNKDWKADAGAIENKNRPEAVYVTFSSWVKPKLSVVKAQASSTSDPSQLAISVMKDFEKEVGRISKKISSVFDSELFDTSSIIFDYDFPAEQAKPGKRQYLEIEINIDTVNDIDFNDEPAPHAGTGRVNHIPFKDFVPALTKAIDKIIEFEVFHPKKSLVDYSKVKGK